MKKVLYDLMPSQPIKEMKFHGGGEYCKVIFNEVVKQMDKGTILNVTVNESVSMDPIIKGICMDKKIEIHNCRSVSDLTEVLSKGNYDVFYSALPYSYGSVSIPRETQFIYTIHGLRSLEMPYDKIQFHYGGNYIKNALKRLIGELKPDYWDARSRKPFEMLLAVTNNRRIITVSEHSKYALLYFFPELKEEEIDVLYSPAKYGYLENTKSVKNNENEKTILLISGDRWIKNDLRAICALDELYTTHLEFMKDYKVILLGVTDKTIYSKVKNKEFFHFRGYVESDELDCIYRNAALFVYPTLNEGFGYPPLETMKFGIPCVCSAISSTTEVCGDAVFYVNPFSVKEIGTRILEALKCGSNKKEKILSQYAYVHNKQCEDLNKIVSIILGSK